jgi:hypothetical protein
MAAAVSLEIDVEPRDSEQARPTPRRIAYLSSSEVAECTCPEWCERDHDRD